MNPLLTRIHIIRKIILNRIQKQWCNKLQCTMLEQHSQQTNGFEQTDFSTNAKPKYRYWKKNLEDKTDTRSLGFKFKVVSYNILAQDVLLEHLHLYKHSKQMYLKWSYRLARLTEKINKQKPDILCLQEVQENHLDDLMTNINLHLPSLKCIYKKKTGFKCDGCAIIYNNEMFEMVQSDVVEFYHPDIELLDRHNIALIVRFRCRSKTEANLLVATTHLLFNPKRQDIRLAQVMVLLAELDRHSIVEPGKLDRMPLVLTGDFNFIATSAPFKLITSGKLCYENLTQKSLSESTELCESIRTGKKFVSQKLRITDNCQHFDCVESNYKNCPPKLLSTNLDCNDPKLFSTGTLTHELNLRSAYNHFEGVLYGSIFQYSWVTVDHLFYSQEDQSKHNKGALRLLSVYQLPNVEQCKSIGILPNETQGSDHFLLAARFYFKFPKDDN